MKAKVKTSAHNTGIASGGLQWLNEILRFYSSSVLADSFVLRNPPKLLSSSKKTEIYIYVS